MKGKLLEKVLREAIETATIKAGETAKDIFNKLQSDIKSKVR